MSAAAALPKRSRKSKKKTRDPTKPKRPLSPYMLFANEQRAVFRSKFPNESLMEVSKRIAAAWRALEDRASYEADAATLKEAYQKAMEAWRAKQPPKIKRPRSAYALYVQAKRPEFAAKFPDKSSTELMKEMGLAWRGASEDEKNSFREKAAADKQRFARESGI